jgi:hypothetical protein|tara:strand:- start:223 stop:414 length:192 start_codon:yes stop_codon:yes gene_type:complete
MNTTGTTTLPNGQTIDEDKAIAIAALRHIAEVCVRNEDGSVTLGTEDIKNIEAAIKASRINNN